MGKNSIFWMVGDVKKIGKRGHDENDTLYENKSDAIRDKKEGELIKVVGLFRISIGYKSGLKFTGTFINFSYKKQGDNLKIEWESFLNNVNPHPLYMNIDEVESIWVEKEGLGYEYNGKTIYVTEGF